MKERGSTNDQREQVRDLYTQLANNPQLDFGWGRGKENARELGYVSEWLIQLPDAVWESSAAVGNPFSIGEIDAGEMVLDLGCGAGADACVAAILVGEQGRVVGIDFTAAMIEKAKSNARQAGLLNVDFQVADISQIPLPEASVDVVISNGAINLSASKACVLKEAMRVLRPGGRMQIADMVRDESQPSCASSTATEAGWANCVTGTLTPECFIEMLNDAGFVDAVLVKQTDYRTSATTVGSLFFARKPED